IRKALSEYMDSEVPKVVPSGQLIPAGKKDQPDETPPVVTIGVQNLLQRALFHVQSSGKDEVQPKDLFVALFQAKDSRSLYLLTKFGIERLDVLHIISHGVLGGDDNIPAVPTVGTGEEEARKPKREADALETYATNLNELARAGRIDPLIGRQTELERMVQTLCRRRKNNPLLVGEAGVGKTALAEGLAVRIVDGEVPDLLKNAEVYSLDMGTLLAGARFRGDFEQRLKKVLSELVRKKDQGKTPILFIDEIHTVIGAGAVSGGVLDAANILKPFLSRGEIRCIGSTTYAEYRNVFEKDHALARRFQKIDVTEPTVEDTIQILRGLKSKFETHHDVKFSEDAIRAAVDLSVKHLTERFLPDKAIDLIDEAGARARLSKKNTVDAAAIEQVVAQIARIPERSVSSNQKDRLKMLDRDLKLAIFGQDHAIEVLTTAIRLARSGLRSGEKPVGSFLFCGPTGVGKTELSKQLAHSMGVPFQRFDMSEYMEKHTVSRLIGAPPGYVGFEQAGLLTEAARKHPHCVILLDEVEKAHPDVWNILLQVMDHGTLTDNYGRKSDYRNIVLIMTSNVGAREMERLQLGMGPVQAPTGAAQKEVEKAFSPEFRNRLDATIYFNPLNMVTIAQVVGKQLVELESQLLTKNVEIDISPEVREWLAQKGYDRTMGARPMARLIQDKIRKPLAEEILFGKLENGGWARLTLKGGTDGKEGEIHFDYEPRKPSTEAERAGASSKSEPVS
ncbi:MAG: AAA family ATPase, partial [Deltaproteobacteria bacterium]|nr:AAA family ATPase [Deltaproteobacteria bacterium]